MFWKLASLVFSFCSLMAIVLFLNVRQTAAGSVTFSGSELLGNPTDTSITINVVPEADINIYYEYGTSPGVYTNQTATGLATADEPYEIVISGLQPDTRYYYRMQYEEPSDPGVWTIRDEHTFHTARPRGSTYEFVLTSDSHVNILLGNLSEWQTTLDLIDDDNPDFLIDLGDTFAMDGVATEQSADAAYLYQRDPNIMGRASHSVPIFLAMGNHENEEGWNFDDVNPQPIFGMKARKRYFPLPSPNTDPSFYSANTDPVEADDVSGSNSHIIGTDQYRENYYAWEWGDALFVVFDPFQYTMQNPYGASAGEGNDEIVGGDRWNWTMGVQQHQWLRDTLANSDAKYKFLFAHHMLGGTANYVRSGAEAATWFEWGGNTVNSSNQNPVWEFDTKRPAGDGWIEPVHQMMQDYNVSAFFHGHDHQFVHEERDGIVYQLVPAASQGTSLGFNLYQNSPYVVQGGNLSNSGYLRITIDPDMATVEYVKSTGNNVGQVQYSYTIDPNITEPTASFGDVDGNGSVNSTDALILLTYDAGLPVSVTIDDCSDVNNDDSVNSTDALIILTYDAGLPVAFPVGETCSPS